MKPRFLTRSLMNSIDNPTVLKYNWNYISNQFHMHTGLAVRYVYQKYPVQKWRPFNILTIKEGLETYLQKGEENV
jgi:hypothetical protein